MRHLNPVRWLLVHLGAAALLVAAVSADPAADAALASWNGGQVRVRDWLDAYGVKTVTEQRALSTPHGRVQLLRDLERYALLIQEAERRGYGQHVLVRDAVRNAANDAFTKTLAVPPESISAADVAAELEATRTVFERPSIRRASLIAVASEAEAKDLLRELRGASREQFGSVARTRSIDDTRRQSGELGWFTHQGRGTNGDPMPVSAPLVAATFALPRVGALSPRPVRLPQGFGVLMLTGEEPPFSTPFDEVDARIREQLAARRSAQRLEDLLAQLRASTKVEVHPELLAPIALDTEAGLDVPQGFPAHPPDPRVGPRVVKPDKY
jgi:peptidyl-prolyl cis-trans isomerase C